jgi:large subunit ribosomal protein L23
MADEFNKYSFKVHPKARKPEIRRAIESIFDGAKVSSVNIMNQLGKRKRMRSAKYGRRADWKKAIVTLSEGTIEVF